MEVTEEEAKEKWCPMIRITIGQKACDNRGRIDEVASLTCIASRCMVWVWLDNIMAYDKEYRKDNPDCIKRYPEEKRKGHCGLTR